MVNPELVACAKSIQASGHHIRMLGVALNQSALQDVVKWRYLLSHLEDCMKQCQNAIDTLEKKG